MFTIHVNRPIGSVQKPERTAKPMDPRFLSIGTVKIMVGDSATISTDAFLRNRRWLQLLVSNGDITVTTTSIMVAPETSEPEPMVAPETSDPEPVATSVDDEVKAEGEVDAVTEPTDRLAAMSRNELLTLCSENGIKAVGMKKSDMLEALHAQGLE